MELNGTPINFYPRSPCGERLQDRFCGSRNCYFYPRSPCGERLPELPFLPYLAQFLSTLSLRRATHAVVAVQLFRRISIHALLAESDWRSTQTATCIPYFYPRSPCGERLSLFSPSGKNAAYFYPRSPCGERRQKETLWQNQQQFLSTLSLRRATRRHKKAPHFTSYFYPRSPCGERQTPCVKLSIDVKFLSTLSLRRATHIILC